MPIESPYLAVAVFCEKVLQEGDGVVSAIRVIDRANIVVPPGFKFEQLPSMKATMLLSFKSGDYKGVGKVSVSATSPDGKRMAGSSLELPVELKGGDQGANVILNLEFQAEREGTYWFDIAFDGRPITRIPLTVALLTQTIQTRPSEISPDRQSPKH